MKPTPEDELHLLGAAIRSARIAQGLTQQTLAREAKVSRAQLALFEKGGNVSVKFLLKLAHFLGLPLFANLDGTAQQRSGLGGLNVFELIRSLDAVSAMVERMRVLSMDAVLPSSARADLKDTTALREFIERHAPDAAGFARLEEALFRLSDEPLAPRPSALPERESKTKVGRTTRRRGR